MSLLLHIIVTYIKENIITKLQKLYSLPRNPRAGNKSPALFVKKPLCTGDLSPSCKIFIERPVNVTKNAFFFLSRAPTHHSFTNNSRFIHEAKDKVHLSKGMFRISHFQVRLVFIKAYIFVQPKAWTL